MYCERVPQPQTLAEYLGVPASLTTGETDDSLAAHVEQITDGREFGLAVLNSLEFRRYILLGLSLGTLPGFTSILGRLLDHAIGKAPERVEHTGKDGQPIEITEVRRIIVRPSQQQHDDEDEREPYITH